MMTALYDILPLIAIGLYVVSSNTGGGHSCMAVAETKHNQWQHWCCGDVRSLPIPSTQNL